MPTKAQHKFWVAVYHHRFGETVYPIWQDRKPSLRTLLKTEPDFGRDWEGPGRLDGYDPREGEWVEMHGPYYVPGHEPKRKKRKSG